MLDTHYIPSDQWGIHPVLFQIGSFKVESYPSFIMLALLVGSMVYFLEARRQHTANEPTFLIALTALVGGAIGAKIPIWLSNWHWFLIPTAWPLLLSGRTIVGGIIGGTLAIWLVKRIYHLEGKRGNLFAPAIALAMAIGRIGCYLRGCCYGVATSLQVGTDFGDGIHRHPTQLYEAAFWFCLFIFLEFYKNRTSSPGKLYQILLISYFCFRFVLEFIKEEPQRIGTLSLYQAIVLIGLLYVVGKMFYTRTMQKAKSARLYS